MSKDGPLFQYLKSWPVDGGSFDDLIKSAEKDEFATFVWLARVLIDDSLKCLSEKWARHGWIHTHSASLLAAVDQWLTEPSEAAVLRAKNLIGEIEDLADRAFDDSTEPGDWTTNEAMECIGFLCVAIAQDAGVVEATHDYPIEPLTLVRTTCEFFSWFPASDRSIEAVHESVIARWKADPRFNEPW